MGESMKETEDQRRGGSVMITTAVVSLTSGWQEALMYPVDIFISRNIHDVYPLFLVLLYLIKQ